MSLRRFGAPAPRVVAPGSSRDDRSDGTLSPWSRLAQLVFDVRLVAAALTIVEQGMRSGRATSSSVWFALGVALAISYFALRYAEEADALVQARPQLLALDLTLGVILLAILGAGSPFVYYTVSSVLLAGLLRGERAAALAAVVLLAVYALLVLTGTGFEVSGQDFQTYVGLPSLYPLAAVIGVAVRRVFDGQRADALRIRRLSIEEAADEERSLLAREMHDSIAGDLSGIALSAAALPELIGRDPSLAAERAAEIAAAANRTAHGARDVIRVLRETGPDIAFERALDVLVREWSARTGNRVVITHADRFLLPVEARYEVLSLCKEALENVSRHAGPCTVSIEAVLDGNRGTLTVHDDGRGFAADADRAGLVRAGHYGLLGMTERAVRLGGSVEVRSTPGAGTAVVLTVPLPEPAR